MYALTEIETEQCTRGGASKRYEYLYMWFYESRMYSFWRQKVRRE